MSRSRLALRRLGLPACLLLLLAPVAAAAAAPAPRVDARGFIDVWQLRQDVIALEPQVASDDTDGCWPEAFDPDVPPTDEEVAAYDAEGKACEARVHARFAAYDQARAALNTVWRPLLLAALAKGDPVAEVLLRRCDTTPVLDRSGIETTCDEDRQKQAVARARLKAIGFVPAEDLAAELVRDWGNPGVPRDQRERNQLAVLRAMRHGVLGFDQMLVDVGGGNTADSSYALNLHRRWAVMEAARQEAPRAFTFFPGSNSAGWATQELVDLRLNRQPRVPGYMTWGPALFYGGSNDPYTGPRYWRAGGETVYVGPIEAVHVEIGEGHSRDVPVSGEGVADFQRERRQLLADMQANIDRYLKADPRWAVFLLERAGRHEWVPYGTKTRTHLVDPGFVGTWVLQRAAADWTSPLVPVRGKAVIRRDGEFLRMTAQAEAAAEPLPDLRHCLLRYSGGLTYAKTADPGGEDPLHTMLGYFYSGGGTKPGSFSKQGANREAVAPFAPAMRYRQVLLQCAQGESVDNARIRFVLLAGDTLVEFGARDPWHGGLAVRHYRRWKPGMPLPADPPPPSALERARQTVEKWQEKAADWWKQSR